MIQEVGAVVGLINQLVKRLRYTGQGFDGLRGPFRARRPVRGELVFQCVHVALEIR